MEHFLETFARLGGTIEEAALASTIPYHTIQGWLEKYPEFRARRDAVKAGWMENLVPGAMEAYKDALANKGDVKHRLHVADKVLQTAGLVKEAERTTHMSGPDGGAIPIRIEAVAIGDADRGKPFKEITEDADP